MLDTNNGNQNTKKSMKMNTKRDIDSEFGLRMLCTLMPKTPRDLNILWEKTNSPILPKRSLSKSIYQRWINQTQLKRPTTLKRTTISQELLIGEVKVLSPQSRTKDHADHVGLSQPPESLKDTGRLTRDNSQISLNNNWLIVQLLTTDVTVDGHTRLLPTSKRIH